MGQGRRLVSRAKQAPDQSLVKGRAEGSAAGRRRAQGPPGLHGWRGGGWPAACGTRAAHGGAAEGPVRRRNTRRCGNPAPACAPFVGARVVERQPGKSSDGHPPVGAGGRAHAHHRRRHHLPRPPLDTSIDRPLLRLGRELRALGYEPREVAACSCRRRRVHRDAYGKRQRRRRRCADGGESPRAASRLRGCPPVGVLLLPKTRHGASCKPRLRAGERQDKRQSVGRGACHADCAAVKSSAPVAIGFSMCLERSGAGEGTASEVPQL